MVVVINCPATEQQTSKRSTTADSLSHKLVGLMKHCHDTVESCHFTVLHSFSWTIIDGLLSLYITLCLYLASRLARIPFPRSHGNRAALNRHLGHSPIVAHKMFVQTSYAHFGWCHSNLHAPNHQYGFQAECPQIAKRLPGTKHRNSKSQIPRARHIGLTWTGVYTPYSPFCPFFFFGFFFCLSSFPALKRRFSIVAYGSSEFSSSTTRSVGIPSWF